MTTPELLIALIRWGRRAQVLRVAYHAARGAVIGALQHEADADYVAQLRRLRDGMALAEAP